MIPELRKVLKRLHYPLEVMLVCVRWYAAYPLSFRHLEEMMQERGVFVDHSTVDRWALKILPVMALIFRRRKRPVGNSWRMDETYIKSGRQVEVLVPRSRQERRHGGLLAYRQAGSGRSTALPGMRHQFCMTCLKKSPSTRVVTTPQPFAASMTMHAWILNYASPNISTTSLSRITGR